MPDLLEQVQADTTAALKGGDRPRAQALRLVASELQKARKEAASAGGAPAADDVAVLQRERKRRIEAAEAYREGGRSDLAAAAASVAQIIEGYLPEQLSDQELHALVGDAVAETGAASPKEMGRVMSLVMPRVASRAGGKRVSADVREKLAAS